MKSFIVANPASEAMDTLKLSRVPGDAKCKNLLEDNAEKLFMNCAPIASGRPPYRISAECFNFLTHSPLPLPEFS